jgi:hypothetical protein
MRVNPVLRIIIFNWGYIIAVIIDYCQPREVGGGFFCYYIRIRVCAVSIYRINIPLKNISSSANYRCGVWVPPIDVDPNSDGVVGILRQFAKNRRSGIS